VDWGYDYYNYSGGMPTTECYGFKEGGWNMQDLKAIQAGVHIMDKGVSFLGGNFKSLIGISNFASRKEKLGYPHSDNPADTDSNGVTIWRISTSSNEDSEKYRLYATIHEMGHTVAWNRWPEMMDYFMSELGAHCSNQPVDRIGYYCNENQQSGVDYKPGTFAGPLTDPNKYMPSDYSTKGSYEDFAETWREVVTRACIRSGDTRRYRK
jgi:hypothetical protein